MLHLIVYMTPQYFENFIYDNQLISGFIYIFISIYTMFTYSVDINKIKHVYC